MTGNKEFFSSLNLNTKGKVKFGDGSCVDIVGKGVVTFVCKTGEKKALKDIYYIPDLKANILSLGQATENGCEVNMKDAYLTLTDSCGRLLVRVTRSPNRLYKTPMKISYPQCLHVRDEDATWRWHARLGHISYGVMNNMVKKEMVVGMPSVSHAESVCDACLAEKQTRHTKKSCVTHEESVCNACLAEKKSCVTHEESVCDTCLAEKQIRHSFQTRLLKKKTEVFYRFKRFKEGIGNFRTDRGGEITSDFCTDRGGEITSDLRIDRGGEFASSKFNLSQEWVEAMVAEMESTTRNKTWELVRKEEEDRVYVLHKALYGLRQTHRAWNVKLDQVLEEMRVKKCTKEPSVYRKHEVIQGADGYAQGIMCDTKMEGCNTTYVPMRSSSEISGAKDENALGVEQKVDILTRAHVRKMADVTRVILANALDLVEVRFIHKTHRYLSEEVRRRFYKNWANSKKRRYRSEEIILSNREKDVTPMDGFAHYGVVSDDYLRIKFKQMRSLIGVQEIDLPNSSWN